MTGVQTCALPIWPSAPISPEARSRNVNVAWVRLVRSVAGWPAPAGNVLVADVSGTVAGWADAEPAQQASQIAQNAGISFW